MKEYLTGTLLFIFLLTSAEANASKSKEPKPTVIVFELQSKDLNPNQMSSQTKRLKKEIQKVGKFKVLLKKDIDEIILQRLRKGLSSSQNESLIKFRASGSCENESCVIELGKLLGAYLGITGSIRSVGDMYLMELQIISIPAEKKMMDFAKEVVGNYAMVGRDIIPFAAKKISEFAPKKDTFLGDTRSLKKKDLVEGQGVTKWIKSLNLRVGTFVGVKMARLKLNPQVIGKESKFVFAPSAGLELRMATENKFSFGMKYSLDYFSGGRIESVDPIQFPSFSLRLINHIVDFYSEFNINDRIAASLSTGPGFSFAKADLDAITPTSLYPLTTSKQKKVFFQFGCGAGYCLRDSESFQLSANIHIQELLLNYETVGKAPQDTKSLEFSGIPGILLTLAVRFK